MCKCLCVCLTIYVYICLPTCVFVCLLSVGQAVYPSVFIKLEFDKFHKMTVLSEIYFGSMCKQNKGF